VKWTVKCSFFTDTGLQNGKTLFYVAVALG
jgi:hypothetical protein